MTYSMKQKFWITNVGKKKKKKDSNPFHFKRYQWTLNVVSLHICEWQNESEVKCHVDTKFPAVERTISYLQGKVSLYNKVLAKMGIFFTFFSWCKYHSVCWAGGQATLTFIFKINLSSCVVSENTYQIVSSYCN